MLSKLSKDLPRIAIIGVGQVGGAVAYALILASISCEILLVDVNVDRRKGQLHDLSDAAYVQHSSTFVREATYAEAGQSDIVIVTAGSRFTLGQTRNQMEQRNVSLVRSAVSAMAPFRSDTIILVVSNPNDLLVSIAQEASGLPVNQVFGSGTFLDSVRIRSLLAQDVGIAPSAIDINVLGMQGQDELVAWSNATINGTPLTDALPTGLNADVAALEDECKQRSRHITEEKGSTPFGIGCAVAHICISIVLDRLDVHPLSHFQKDFGCYFSLPAVIGRAGIVRSVPISLSSSDKARIEKSAEGIKSILAQIAQDQH